jgi:ADP-ribose pyrophosphatase YjhB (NUDIX family)
VIRPVLHPRPDERGRPVALHRPSVPTPLAAWADPTAVARVVPDGPMPAALGGLAFGPWSDAPRTDVGWARVPGLAPDLAEPAWPDAPGRARATGTVVVEPDGRVWVVHPSNAFGGYAATFPKGRLEGAAGAQSQAIRETFEEAGLRVAILAWLVDVPRTTTLTRFWLARRTGGTPAAMGWESQAVSLVPASRLAELVDRPADAPVIEALRRVPATAIAAWNAPAAETEPRRR